MVTSWIVVVLFLQILQVSCQSLSSDILAISNGIGLSSKSINIFKNDTWSDSQLIKELFLEGYNVQITKNLTKLGEERTSKLNVLFLNEENSKLEILHPQLQVQNALVILNIQNNNTFAKLQKELELNIGQEVYLYKKSTKELFEHYTINKIPIKKKLGQIQNDHFIWEDGVNSNVLHRRSDFHGLTLKCMTEFSGGNMNAYPNYEQEATFFYNNKTYRVDGFTYGLFHDVLEIMKDRLNFSATLYKHEEVTWAGKIYSLDNGTIVSM